MANPADLSHAQEMYDLYVDAEKSILKSQSYSIGGKELTRADLAEVVSARKYWGDMVQRLTPITSTPVSNAPRVTRVVPYL